MNKPLPFPVSRETIQLLTEYEKVLLKWCEKVNLVSRETLVNLWERHFWDSAQLSLYISDPLTSIIDLGSGAGFPGMVLAAMGYKKVTLVEKDKKKVSFLKNIAIQLGLDVSIKAERFEDISPCVYDVVVSRACASLRELLKFSQRFTDDKSQCIFLKGRGWREEMEAAQKEFQFTCTDHSSLIQKESKVLIITGMKVHS